MADTTKKPVIFLAFANDRDDTVNYLRNLPEEARQIREPFQRERRDGLCEIVELADSTADAGSARARRNSVVSRHMAASGGFAFRR